MTHEVEEKNAAEEHDHHDHPEVVPNPDYAGPGQHCLPPDVKEGIGQSFYFILLMIVLLVGAAWLGKHLL